MKKLLFASLLFLFIHYSYAQDWTDIGPEEDFPFLSWNDVKDAHFPTLDQYESKVLIDYQRTKKTFGFQSVWFDIEQLDYLQNFSTLLDTIFQLLPPSCHYKIVKVYTNKETNKWTVNLDVNGSFYQFSTKGISGVFLDLDNLLANLKKILKDHAPEYQVVIPDIPSGQDMELLIEKKSDLLAAAKAGFPYPPFEITWKKPIPIAWSLHLPDCKKVEEEQLVEAYIETFNAFFTGIFPPLSPEHFHICMVEGYGIFYIYLNGRVIGTPSIYKQQWLCSSAITEFILGYVLAKLNGCDIYFHDDHIRKRRPISLEELKALIVSRNV